MTVVRAFVCAVAVACAANIAQAISVVTPPPPVPTDKEIIDNAIEKTPIRYPQAAYDAEIEGSVTVEIVIGVDGVVKSVTVIKAEPTGWGFEEAAVEAVKKWRYRPAGREIKYTTIIDFEIPPKMRVPQPS